MAVPDFFKPTPGGGLVPVGLKGEEVQSVEGVAEIAELFARRRGFNYFLVQFTMSPRPGRTVNHKLSNYREDWLLRYLDRGYVSLDPMHRAVREELTPFTWSQLARANPYAAEYFADAAAHDMKDAVVVPWSGPRGARGSYCMVTDLGRLPTCDVDDVAGDALVFATYMFRTLVELVDSREGCPEASVLTDGQREVLQYIARGMSLKEAAQRIGVDWRSARERLDRAIANLGVATREEAIVRAVETGELYLPRESVARESHFEGAPVRTRM